MAADVSHDGGEERTAKDREDMEEMYHFHRVVGSFLGYEAMTMAEAERTRRATDRLTLFQQSLLPDGAIDAKVEGVRSAARVNGAFLRMVVENQGAFGPEGAHSDMKTTVEGSIRSRPRDADFSKVRSTLHSLVRDWTREGAREREQCYTPLLDTLKRLFPKASSKIRVLVPGAGLGRLVLEVAALGYSAQGNEFSYHMLLVSNFILNAACQAESILIHPFVDQPSNVREAADRLRVVAVPDVAPATLLGPVLHNAQDPIDFSMAAGEFLSVYEPQAREWAAVVTSFFVDTAPNILEYIDAIYRLLIPGGAWINLGPLLYHWVPSSDAMDYDCRYAQSIELAYDELKFAILRRGFLVVNEEWHVCNYTSNPRSMMCTTYDCVLFTAIKPIEPPPP